MKKKIISVAIVTSVLMTGVVSAASMWGTYKGNDIVRITSNGETLKTTDVPAISYNGRTMIPISMLGQVGLGYTWDQNNKTVDVVNGYKGENNLGTNVSVNGNSTEIKKYVGIADFYNKLETLGGSLADLSSGYSLVFNEISNQNKNISYTQVNKQLNELISSYNNLQTSSLIYNDLTMNSIFLEYYTAIDFFKDADYYISSYYITKTNSDFDNYINNSSDGFNKAYEGRTKALTGYQKYIRLALNN